MARKKTRVLITDDMVTYRIIISSILRTFEDVEIVGTAKNGAEALEKITACSPDIITLDVEMPVMDGLTALKKIKTAHPGVEVIMVSSASRKNADITMKALEAGAFDFIVKPEAASADEARRELSEALRKHITAITEGKRPLSAAPSATTKARLKAAPALTPAHPPEKVDLIAIGVSTGGPKALGKIMPGLSEKLPPILIVQHMPPLFTKSLADNLNKHSPLLVKEAVEGEPLRPGRAYIAPGGCHMILRKEGSAFKIALSDAPPENSCRPSVDVLFRSIASQFPAGRTLALVLTGMGSDGFKGVQSLKRKGVYCIAQDEASCVVYGMPKFIVDHGLADEVLPLDTIARRIKELAGIK